MSGLVKNFFSSGALLCCPLLTQLLPRASADDGTSDHSHGGVPVPGILHPQCCILTHALGKMLDTNIFHLKQENRLLTTLFVKQLQINETFFFFFPPPETVLHFLFLPADPGVPHTSTAFNALGAKGAEAWRVWSVPSQMSWEIVYIITQPVWWYTHIWLLSSLHVRSSSNWKNWIVQPAPVWCCFQEKPPKPPNSPWEE